MENAIVLYASPEHLNSTSIMAKFIAKHHPNVHVIVISTAETIPAGAHGSVTYHRIPTVDLPPNLTNDPVELFFEVPRLNNANLHKALAQISESSNIKALVIDFFCNAAFEVSTSFNIPTYYDVSSCASGLCVFLYFPTLHETIDGNIGDLNEFIRIPGCPPLHSSDLPRIMFYRESNAYKHLLEAAGNTRKSAGILVNSFEALEFKAKETIAKGLCVPHAPTPPVYFIGPLVDDVSIRNPRHECLTWLDSQPRKSVVFLCFGRRGFFFAEQLREIAVGLEKSGHGFLWSVRAPPGTNSEEQDLKALMPEGFLERTKERGLVVKSWTPQREILSHESVGGFVTHCGMNSVLEALSSGVPMIGWPMYAEQKMNRTFMVEEMKVALPLNTAGGVVPASEVELRVRELMDSSSEMGRIVRERVGELRKEAETAVRDRNGSSVVALGRFVDAVKRR